MLPVVALVALPADQVLTADEAVRALTDGGFPVLGARTLDDGTLVLPWISEDGPHQVRITAHPGLPDARLGPRSPEPERLAVGRRHLRITLLQGPEERLDADVLATALVAALIPALPVVAVRLEHRGVWLHPEEWASLSARDAGFGVPAELLVDLEVGPLGPDALGVLSEGLDRYGLREVLVVADRSRLADAWELAASLVEDRLLGAEPDVDLSPGPHPRRPGERVDVGFVDEDPDDDLEIEIVEDPGPEGEA